MLPLSHAQHHSCAHSRDQCHWTTEDHRAPWCSFLLEVQAQADNIIMREPSFTLFWSSEISLNSIGHGLLQCLEQSNNAHKKSV